MTARRLLISALMMVFTACTLAPAPAPSTPTGLRLITAIPTPAQTAPPAASSPMPAPTSPPRTCTDDEIAARLRAVPAFRPAAGRFAVIVGQGFVVGAEPFPVRGFTYAPQAGDIFAGDLLAIEADLLRLRALGITTLRFFVPYGPLFTCAGHGAVPSAEAVARLDAVIALIGAYGLRAIPVLHHGAGTPSAPLYTTPGDTQAQTAFLVSRYRAEPAILAWDLRDAGDADYGVYSREVVLDWLSRSAAAVRALDPRHPITAGWGTAPEDTIPFVDLVGLHHFGGAADLRQRVAGLRALTAKPLLLIAFGVSTQQVNETAQASTLRAVIRAAEGDRLAGWLLWTVYDGPPDPACGAAPCQASAEISAAFGLWRADGSPKPAVEVLAGVLAGS